MIRDILTVMWKERKGLFRQGGSRIRAVFILVVPVAMISIVFPWGEGRGWLESYFSLIASVIIPLLLVGTTIAESFAGERERHTLGTLLASRLPDRAILFGKIAVAVTYAWGVTLLALLLALITVNITHWDGQVMLYTPTIALANVVLSLLMASLMAGLGVLISLRAATVQEAAMTLMAATLMPLLVLGVIVTAFFRDLIKDVLGAADPTKVIIIAMAVLFVACLGLFWAAMARFRRERLILD